MAVLRPEKLAAVQQDAFPSGQAAVKQLKDRW
jgi:hypothetical protein